MVKKLILRILDWFVGLGDELKDTRSDFGNIQFKGRNP